MFVMLAGGCIRATLTGAATDAAQELDQQQELDHQKELDQQRELDHQQERDTVVPDVGLPDGLACTTDDDCDDGIPCTVNTCSGGACVFPLAASSCRINQICYYAGTQDLANPCRRCDPTASQTAWTSVSKCVWTLAGSGTPGKADGPAASAQFNLPKGVAADGTVGVYVADTNNHRIRLVSQGKVSTPAGTGTAGFANGIGSAATFNFPRDVAVGSTGVVLIADQENHAIRTLVQGVVSTLVGDGIQGFADGPTATAKLNDPRSVAVVGANKVYVADMDNHRIRVVAAGQVSTGAGSGTAGYADGLASTAQFNSPRGVAVDSGGKVYVADWSNHRIRVIEAGQVSTLAGDGQAGLKDGPAGQARFKNPVSVAVDSGGKVYVGDWGNHSVRVIEAGQVSTVAGTGQAGFADGPAATARFNGLGGIALDSAGNIVVADTHNYRIRVIYP